MEQATGAGQQQQPAGPPAATDGQAAKVAGPGAPRDKGLPDGAKPGAAQDEGNRYGYNADARADERESGVITLGGLVLHRVRKTWDVSKELRNLLRENEKIQDKSMRLEAVKDAKAQRIRGVQDLDTGGWTVPPLMDDTEVEQVEDEIAGIDEKIDQLAEDSDQCAYDMVRLLLRFAKPEPVGEGEGDARLASKPTDAWLKEELAAEDAAALVRMLTRGGEPDPTPTSPTS